MTDDARSMEEKDGSRLAPYRVEHQILLVGKNPLPNAVAGKLLTMPDGKITLIHSWDTAPTARKLQKWLEREGLPLPTMKEVEESNATSIMQGVLSQLSDSDGKTLGLNYTGGTKAMSVHAYRAVENWGKDKKHRPVFSYLDARTLQLIFDATAPASGEPPVKKYVGLLLQLNFLDLLTKLHGWMPQPGHIARRQAALPQTADALATVYANENFAEKWGEWKRNILSQQCRVLDKNGKPTDKWKAASELARTSISLPNSPHLQAVKTALQKELSITDDKVEIGALEQKHFNGIAKDFCEWLDGKWLEHCVLDILHCLSKRCHLHEYAQEIKTAKVDFEVDVVALRGYQLFAFSCSTREQKTPKGKSDLKKRLFEIFIRARQLGGDEARVALVTISDDPDGLTDEMQNDVDPEGRIRVFGRQHLVELSTHIEEWIQSQSGEPT